ncbi:MAG: caspase family protein [Burkholderiaceae bacterium]|nr:caspase family protein [Rhodoferax sp.]MCP5283565.1 caspase family protein [Burkholderiaceae bacterium]
MRPNPFLPTALAAVLSLVCPLPLTAATDRNLVVQATAPGSAAVKRLALVVGNGAYADAPLQNPPNDARAMARALEGAGFEVLLHTDADQRTLMTALREFGQRLRGGGTGLFYYAGHGMQIRGRNYLIPVGADIQREDEVAYQSLDVQAVLDKMDSAANGTNLVILDACRNNPFARSFRSSTQGLAPVDAPVGTLVAFATCPGAVASDGATDNGLYTRHLLQALAEPGRKVEEVFKQVRTQVRRDSGGQQIPWESTSLEGEFYFHPPVAMASPPPPLPPPPAQPAPDPLAALDAALWATVRDAQEVAVVQAYLTRFPQGRHAAEAMARLAVLQALPSQTAASAATDPAPEVTAPTQVSTPAPAALPVPGPAHDAATASLLAAGGGRHGTDANDALARLAALAAAEGARPSGHLAGTASPAIASAPAPSPATPVASPAAQRNVHGFQVGDWYNFRTVDRLTGITTGRQLWRIEGFAEDGDIIVNGGGLRLTSLGLPIAASDPARGTWLEWKPPLQMIDTSMHVGYKRDVNGVREQRDSQGRSSRSVFKGALKVVGRENVEVPAGNFEAFRIEVRAQGDTERDDGARYTLWWDIKLWWAPAFGMWVAMDVDERVDGRLEQRTRRELWTFERLRDTATAEARR